jgi:tyrosyl-tRNA synthetase
LELTAVATVQQVLKRQDFAKRIAEDRDITLLETLYPLLQGYDSVAVKSDVELGGTDQLLNVLMGRKVQRHYRVPEQDVLTVSLLEGLDGTKKMSKSIGNTVNIFDSPEEMFGKVMTLPDALVVRWFTLATDMSMEEVAGYERDLKKGTNPKLIKSKLALEIAKRYHGSKAALAAQENFENLFAKKDLAVADMPELKISGKMTALDLVMKSGVAASRGDARRLIEQGAVSVDGEARKDAQEKPALKTGTVVKIGKKNFFRIKA